MAERMLTKFAWDFSVLILGSQLYMESIYNSNMSNSTDTHNCMMEDQPICIFRIVNVSFVFISVNRFPLSRVARY